MHANQIALDRAGIPFHFYASTSGTVKSTAGINGVYTSDDITGVQDPRLVGCKTFDRNSSTVSLDGTAIGDLLYGPTINIQCAPSTAVVQCLRDAVGRVGTIDDDEG